MNPNAPDFISDNSPDFIPDDQAGQYFSNQSNQPTSVIGDLPLPGGAMLKGSAVRGASDFVRNTPGMNAYPQAAGDIYDLVRGIQEKMGNPAGFGYRNNVGQYTTVENPFRGPNVEQETRSTQHPLGAVADFGKSAAGLAAGNIASGVPSLLGATGASQALGYSHPIIDFLVRNGLGGLLGGAAAGIGTESPTPGSVGLTAGAGAILQPLLGLLSKGITTGGIGQNMGKTVQKATEEGGNSTSLADISTEAKQNIAERVDPLDQKEAQRILGEYVRDRGHDIIQPTQLSPEELLDWQRQLSPKAQGNFIQQLLSTVQKPNAGVKNQVAEILRSTVSNQLKDSVPDMRLLNALYGAYKNPWIGSPASWPFRIPAYLGIGGAVGKAAKGIESAL